MALSVSTAPPPPPPAFSAPQGFYFTNSQLNGVNIAESPHQEGVPAEFKDMPIAELVLEQPKSQTVMHELLDVNLRPVDPPEQPGSYVYTQVRAWLPVAPHRVLPCILAEPSHEQSGRSPGGPPPFCLRAQREGPA